jgi:hypothetical protein
MIDPIEKIAGRDGLRDILAQDIEREAGIHAPPGTGSTTGPRPG